MLRIEDLCIHSTLLPQHFFLYRQSIYLYVFNYFLQKQYIMNKFLIYIYSKNYNNYIIEPNFSLEVGPSISQYMLYQSACTRFVHYFLLNNSMPMLESAVCDYIMVAEESQFSYFFFSKITRTILYLQKQNPYVYKQHSLLLNHYYDYVFLFLNLFKNKKLQVTTKSLPRYNIVGWVPTQNLQNDHLSYNLLLLLLYYARGVYDISYCCDDEWSLFCYSRSFSYYYYTVYKNSSELLKYDIVCSN